ncbi:MAG: hypothetical protein COA94_03560, partial [Rickettsiales bacterium]
MSEQQEKMTTGNKAASLEVQDSRKPGAQEESGPEPEVKKITPGQGPASGRQQEEKKETSTKPQEEGKKLAEVKAVEATRTGKPRGKRTVQASDAHRKNSPAGIILFAESRQDMSSLTDWYERVKNLYRLAYPSRGAYVDGSALLIRRFSVGLRNARLSHELMQTPETSLMGTMSRA